MITTLFYILCILTLVAALMVVLSRNMMYSVLYLVATFFLISGQYVLLNAQFLALVNIVVYAGAIMVLFLFVVMLLNLNEESGMDVSRWVKIVAVLSAGGLFLILLTVFRTAYIPVDETIAHDNSVGLVEHLGKVLYDDYLLPFELSAILFIVAMIGAVSLGKWKSKNVQKNEL